MPIAPRRRPPVVCGLDLSSTPEMTAETVYDGHGRRGSGRTATQLAALPDGAAFLVATVAQARYCQGLLVLAGRRPDAIIFVNPENCERVMTGRRVASYAVDHAYEELTRRRGMRARDYLAAHCACSLLKG